MLCDGTADCPDKVDEKSCVAFRCPGLLRCRGDQVCVHPSEICDGIVHCLASADDEQSCNIQSCPHQCVCRGSALKCTNLTQLSDVPELITALILQHYIVRQPSPLQHHTSLVHLKMTKCSFIRNTIERTSFSNMIHLRTLVLCENNVSIIKADSFKDLLHLTSIDLRNNKIYVLRQFIFKGLISLAYLNLSNFGIKKITYCSFMGMSNLNLLNLSSNSLDTIKQGAFEGLTNIQHIDLRHNALFGEIKITLSNPSVSLYFDDVLYCCNLDANHRCHVNNVTVATSHYCNTPTPSIYSVVISLGSIMLNLGILCKFHWLKKCPSHKTLLRHIGFTSIIASSYISILFITLSFHSSNFVFLNTLWLQSYMCNVLSASLMTSFMMSKILFLLISLNQLIAVKCVFDMRRISNYVLYASYSVWIVVIIATYIIQKFGVTTQNISCFPLLPNGYKFDLLQHTTLSFMFLTLLMIIGVALIYRKIIRHVQISSLKVSSTMSKRNQTLLARKAVVVVLINVCTWISLLALIIYSWVSSAMQHHGFPFKALVVFVFSACQTIYLVREL